MLPLYYLINIITGYTYLALFKNVLNEDPSFLVEYILFQLYSL